jgi:outer membrane protein W
MKSALVFAVTFIGLAAIPAFAQESAFAPEPGSSQVVAASSRSRPAVERALEITLGAGYAQGFGDIGASQRSLSDLSSAGGEINLGVGYRLDKRFMVGAYGSGSKYSTGDFTSGADIWSATAGVQGNVHFLPDNEWDPWLGLGTGWRGHWVKNASGTDSRHGWDIARLQVGVDYRVSPEFAMAPYVGAGLTTFFTQQLAGQQSFSNVHSPDVNLWVFAGLQGRFDLFGTSTPTVRLASAD